MKQKKSTRKASTVGVAAGALLVVAATPVAGLPTAAADDGVDAVTNAAVSLSSADLFPEASDAITGAAQFGDIGSFFSDEVSALESLLMLPVTTAEDLIDDPLAAPSILLGAAEELVIAPYDIVVAIPADDLLGLSLPYDF